MNLKLDTFKVWEPKIIGIVLIFLAESIRDGHTSLQNQGFLCLLFAQEDGEERMDNPKER